MSWDEYINEGISAVRTSDYASAEQSFKQALQFAKHNFTRDDSRLALTLSLLGHTYFRNEDFRRAELLLEQSLRLHVESSLLNEPCVVMDLFSLGEIKLGAGKRIEACRLFDQTIDRLKAATDRLEAKQAADHFEIELQKYISQLSDHERRQFEEFDMEAADEEETQASVDAHAQETAEAEGDDQEQQEPEAVPVVESATTFSAGSPETSGSGAHSMADVWDHQLKKGLAALHAEEDERESWVSAYLNLESALRLANKMFQPGDERLTGTLKALADASAKLRMFEQAEALYREAISCCKKAENSDPSATMALRLVLGLFYADFDQLPQAKKLLESSKVPENLAAVPHGGGLAARVEKACRLIGTYDSVQNLVRQAQAAEEQKELDKAAKLTNNALTTLRQGFAPNHPETVRVLRYRAQLLRELGQVPQADELVQRADRIERNNQSALSEWLRITEDLPKPDLAVAV